MVINNDTEIVSMQIYWGKQHLFQITSHGHCNCRTFDSGRQFSTTFQKIIQMKIRPIIKMSFII